MIIFFRIHLITPQISPGTEIDKLVNSLDQYTPRSKLKKVISYSIESQKKCVALRKENHNLKLTSKNRQAAIIKLKSTLKKHGIGTDQRLQNNNIEDLSETGQYRRTRHFGTVLTQATETIGSKNVIKQIDKHAKHNNYIENLSNAPNMQKQNKENYQKALETFQNNPDRHIKEVIKCTLSGKSKKQHIRDRSIYGLKNEVLIDAEGFAYHKQARSETLPNDYEVPKPIDTNSYDIARATLIRENNEYAPWIVNNVDNNPNLFEGYRDAYACNQYLLQILHESDCCAGHVPFHHLKFQKNRFQTLTELSNQKILNNADIDTITHLFNERYVKNFT